MNHRLDKRFVTRLFAFISAGLLIGLVFATTVSAQTFGRVKFIVMTVG